MQHFGFILKKKHRRAIILQQIWCLIQPSPKYAPPKFRIYSPPDSHDPLNSYPCMLKDSWESAALRENFKKSKHKSVHHIKSFRKEHLKECTIKNALICVVPPFAVTILCSRQINLSLTPVFCTPNTFCSLSKCLSK